MVVFGTTRGPLARTAAFIGLTAFFCLFGASGQLLAQQGAGGSLGPPTATPAPPPPPAADAEPPLLDVNDRRNFLHLTIDEQKKTHAIGKRYSPKFVAAANSTTLTQAQKLAKFAALQKSMQAEILAVFTPKQRAQWNQIQGRQASLQKLTDQLTKSLTDSQKKKLNALGDQTRTKFLNVQNDKSLTSTQRNAKYSALGKEYKAAADKIYNPAQRGILSKMNAIEKELQPAQ